MAIDQGLVIRVEAVVDEIPTEDEQIAVLIDSMRASAQDTLEALRRRGYFIARGVLVREVP